MMIDDDDAVLRLVNEALSIAEYGLGREGCPFCGAIAVHNEGCVAAEFGARGYAGDVHPDDQPLQVWTMVDIPVINGIATLPDGRTVESDANIVRLPLLVPTQP